MPGLGPMIYVVMAKDAKALPKVHRLLKQAEGLQHCWYKFEKLKQCMAKITE